MFKKENFQQDERIKLINQQISSRAFAIVFFLLLTSIFIKSVILDMKFQYFYSEFLIFMVASVYVVLAGIREGIFAIGLKDRKSSTNFTKIILYTLFSAIVFSVFIGINNYIKYKFDFKMIWGVIIPLFIQYVVISFITFWGLDYISNKRIEKKIKELEKEDEE